MGLFLIEVPSGAPLVVNQGAAELLGQGMVPGVRPETMGETYDAYVQGTDELYPSEKMPIVRGMQGEVSTIDDMEIRRPDGTRVLIQVIGVPVTDAQGEVTASMALFQDITERKQTELALREQQEFLHQVIDNIPGFVFVKDREGVYVLANEGIAQAYATTVDDLTGKTDADYLDNEEEVRQFRADDLAVMESKEIKYVPEEPITHPDGSEHWLQTTKIPLVDEDGVARRVLGVSTYITELKAAEAERERLQAEIIEAQRRAIQELSTPVIPVMDRIIVMPLVGSIDTMRAKDIMRTLLKGIREHKAKIVILDITGVPIMDSGVANHLNKTIQAARLKGAHTVVTGVSDAVAETIIDLGIDWDQVETLGDLQTGLLYALHRLGVELNRR
jgi:PAS domain S-box-containing protein